MGHVRERVGIQLHLPPCNALCLEIRRTEAFHPAELDLADKAQTTRSWHTAYIGRYVAENRNDNGGILIVLQCW